MNTNISKRLDSIEQALGRSQQAQEIPEALDMISPENRELVLPYLAARRKGDFDSGAWPMETHRAMNRYLGALFERDRMLRDAGVPMASIAEAIRAARQARQERRQRLTSSDT